MSGLMGKHEHFKADQAKQGTNGELKGAGVVSYFWETAVLPGTPGM